MKVIEIENLTRDYGGNKGVFNLSLSLDEGEVFGFLGPNGAGKTTTIRHLMGFLRPKSGKCTINGLDCWKNSSKIQKNLGYIPGEISFFDDMSGDEYLKFIARYRGEKSGGEMKKLLERFELNPAVKLKKMSKGMKQKVGIVAAFMHNPQVLILDEPTSGLDPLMQNRFTELILEERSKGKSILMSSHMFEEIERTCRRVGIIKNGKLMAEDSIESLKIAQIKNYIITLSTQVEAQNFMAKMNTITANSASPTQDACRVKVSIKNNMSEFIAAMNCFSVTNIEAPEQSLEEIFMQYYGGGADV